MMNLTSHIPHLRLSIHFVLRVSYFEFECEALLREPLKAEGFLKLSNIKLLCPKANG